MDLFELTNTHGVIGFLIEITLKGTLILASAGLAASLLKSASAAVRHLIWSTALVLILALPAFVAVAPSYDVAVLPPAIESITSSDLPAVRRQADNSRLEDRTARDGMLDVQSSPEGGGPTSLAPIPALPAVKPDPLPAVRSSELRASSETFDWREALLALWIIGASLVALRYGLGWVALRRIERRTVPVSDVRLRLLVKRIGAGIGLRRRIRLLWGPRGSMPLTFGCLHPTVLLPEGAKDWAPERLMVVLRHELAHVKRWDCLVQAIVYIACTLYWFNPFVWIAAAQSHREREMACDDYVLSGGSEGSEYAGHLLEIARSLQGPRVSGLTTIAMARRSELEGRLLAILSTNRRRGTASTQGVLTTFAILGCLVMTIAALRPVAMKASDGPAQAETEPVAALPAQPAVWPQAAIPADDWDASVTATAHIDEQYIAEASALVEKAAATLEASVNRLLPKTIRLNGSVAAMIDGSVSLAADGRLEIVRPDTIPLEQIRRLRNAGVDVQYIEEMASVGFDRLTVDQLISLAHAGVDAEYVRSLRAAGFNDLSADDLADLGFAGVDVEDIQVWAELGYDNLSSRELIKLAHAGVDAADVRAMAEAGYAGLSPSELV
ncbi:MAG TPA: M56 family metallopeptidase, partial [Rhodothermales bacterium]|nr:M56 family metallopeptidase [Rhodothermales bacterium]